MKGEIARQWCQAWVQRAAPERQTLAWIGLGHAYATLVIRQSGQRRAFDTLDDYRTHFRTLQPLLRDETLGWRVPDEDEPWFLAQLDRILELPPDFLAECVEEAISELDGAPLRIRIRTDAGQFDPAWLAPLRAPLITRGHGDQRVRIVLSVRLMSHARLAPAWPLRIGVLAHGRHDPGLRALPRRRIFTEFIAVGRKHARCDVLLYPGSAAELADDLGRLPLRIRATMLVLRGGAPGDLERLTGLLGASGFATFGDDRVERIMYGMAHLAEGIARGRHFDDAWDSTFEPDIPARLSKQLAACSLKDFEEAFERASGLPRPASPRKRSARTTQGIRQTDESYARARRLARLARDAAHRQDSRDAIRHSAERFLQQQSWVLHNDIPRPALDGFVLRCLAKIDVRIAPKEDAGHDLFHERDEPGVRARSVRLEVVLAEPAQFDEPLRATVELPRTGPSGACSFTFEPRVAGRFEARVIVLHRGRVLQTGLLLAQVVDDRAPRVPHPDAAPRLVDVIRSRARIDDLRDRTWYDLTLVENHLPTGEPRLVALSRAAAWVVRGFDAAEFHAKLNAQLSRVGRTPDKYAQMHAEDAVGILRTLARYGADLRTDLVDMSLSRPGNNMSILGVEYIQLVTARAGPTLPLEIIYDHPRPNARADLCPRWARHASERHCPSACGGGSADIVCPRGFWGVSKVIERHQLSGEYANGGDFYLQSEPDRTVTAIPIGTSLLMATSERLTSSPAAFAERLAARAGIEPLHAPDLDAWAALVAEQNPRLLLCLAHVAGKGVLEINGIRISTDDIDQEHVHPVPGGGAPIALLLGCDTAEAGQTFSTYARKFMRHGAAIVIATNCVVDADQAAQAAEILVTALHDSASRGGSSLGESMRVFRRQALAQNLLLALGVVAFGDADWLITH